MSIKLLTPYGRYPVNAILTLGAATETALVGDKVATTDLTGGVVWVEPTSVPDARPVTTRDGKLYGPDGQELGAVSGAGNSGVEYVFVVGDSHPNNAYYTDGASPDGLTPPAYFVAGASNNNSRSYGFPSWLEAISMGKVVVLASFARQTNGFLTAGTNPVGVPVSVQVTQMMAHKLWSLCTKVICLGGFNDGLFSRASVVNELKAQQARTGKPWAVLSPPPRSDATATTVGGDGMQRWAWTPALRLDLKRASDESGGRLRFIDTYPLVNNPTATPDAWRSGWTYDDIHGNNAPAYTMAKTVVDDLFPAGPGTNFELWRTSAWAGASGANGLVDQGFSNPTFATTTGGTLSTGSGNLPAGLTLTAIGGGSAGLCVVAACDIPGGSGNMVTIPGTTTASGDGWDLTSASAHGAGGTFLTPGDQAYAQMLIRLNGGIYPRNMFFRLTGFNGSNYHALQWELDVSKEIALPLSGSPVFLLRTPILTCPSGAALSSLTFKFRPTWAGAGTPSISVSNPAIIRL